MLRVTRQLLDERLGKNILAEELAGESWVTDHGDHPDRYFPREIELSLALPLGASSFLLVLQFRSASNAVPIVADDAE